MDRATHKRARLHGTGVDEIIVIEIEDDEDLPRDCGAQPATNEPTPTQSSAPNPFEGFRFGGGRALKRVAPVDVQRAHSSSHADAVAKKDIPKDAGAGQRSVHSLMANQTARVIVPLARRNEGLRNLLQWRQSQPKSPHATVDEFNRFLMLHRPAPAHGAANELTGRSELSSCAAQSRDDRLAFQALVALILSVQALDSVALRTMTKLESEFGSEGGLSASAVCATTLERFESLISSINFYKTKAKNIYRSATVIQTTHGGVVPRTFSGLVDLPGVGPKVALVMLTVVFEQPTAGIVVDSNLMRVVHRLGWVESELADAEKVRRSLEAWVPRDAWAEFSLEMIALGQAVCLSKGNPRCDECPLRTSCRSSTDVARQPK